MIKRWRRFKAASGMDTNDLLSDRFPEELVSTGRFGSNLMGMVALLTVVNILFLGVGGARMLHFMDEPRFCGTACHSVMNPEWTTYQNSPHAHVRCVDCHVGSGSGREVGTIHWHISAENEVRYQAVDESRFEMAWVEVRRGLGCARCHNPDMVDETGNAVPHGCTLCHAILADDSSSPFRFLEPADPKDPDYRRHLYLQREFLGEAR